MKYIIAQYKDVGGKLVPKTLKTDVITPVNNHCIVELIRL